MQRFVYGRDLHEVLLADYPARPAWETLPLYTRIAYEKAAQGLNIRLGFLPATDQTCLFAHEHNLILASGLTGLISCIDMYITPHDRFEVYLIEQGEETGYGWYEMGMDRRLIPYEQRGKAEGLAEALCAHAAQMSDQHPLLTLASSSGQTGGHA